MRGVPPGLEWLAILNPGLPPWAKFFHAYGLRVVVFWLQWSWSIRRNTM